MTIQELIEALRKYPLETEVLVHAGGVHFAPIQIAAGEVGIANGIGWALLAVRAFRHGGFSEQQSRWQSPRRSRPRSRLRSSLILQMLSAKHTGISGGMRAASRAVIFKLRHYRTFFLTIRVSVSRPRPRGTMTMFHLMRVAYHNCWRI